MISNLPLFKAMIVNRKCTALNRSMVGFALDDFESLVSKENVMAYARATGDVNNAYLQDKAISPPFYISSIVFEHLKKILVHKELHLNLLRMVHGEQEVIWHKPIHIGDTIRIHIRINSITDTPAGELIQILIQAFVENSLNAESMLGFLVRGSATHSEKSKVENAGKPAAEAFRREIKTWEGQQLLYARVSGDNNFIHTNNIIAKIAGLPRTILHGICFMAMCCSQLTGQLLANDLTRLRSIRGRFSGYVIPGQTLHLIGYESATKNETPFAVINEKGSEVLKNGLFIYQ